MLTFRHRDGFVPNTLALIYIFAGFPLSWYGLLGGFNILLATLLLAHVMIIAAYFLHECAHNTIFSSNQQNARLGNVLAWLTGSCYLPFSHIREKHVRHHLQREDVLLINAHAQINKKPLLKKSIQLAAWCHIPAFDLYTHVLSMCSPFIVKELSHYKARVLWVTVIRLSFLLIAFLINPLAPLFYMIAYTLMVLVLNFMDSLQHTYEIRYDLLSERKAPRFDRDYEEQHTYSNLLSVRFPIINLLVLNFCYHNTHHHKSNEPWYRLPALHDIRYPQASCTQLISFPEQIKRFHATRVTRLSGTKVIDDSGIDGVSFLVGV